MKTIILLLAFLIFGGCTAQERAKRWGGTANIPLPAGQKVVGATWKENSNLWILTRPMRPDEQAEIFTLKEFSSWGVVQGTVVIVEKK